MKYCPKCQKTKETSLFCSNKSRKDGLQSVCRACLAEVRKASYAKNRETVRSKALKRKKANHTANKRRLDEIKTTTPCTDCKQFYQACQMQFDHLKNKKYNISSMVGYYKWISIEDEIKKCELVCANCHALRTHNRRRGLSSGTGALATNQSVVGSTPSQTTTSNT